MQQMKKPWSLGAGSRNGHTLYALTVAKVSPTGCPCRCRPKQMERPDALLDPTPRRKKPANMRALLILPLFILLMCTEPADCSVRAADTSAMTTADPSVQPQQVHGPGHARRMDGFANHSMLDEEAAIEALATLFVIFTFTALAWKP